MNSDEIVKPLVDFNAKAKIQAQHEEEQIQRFRELCAEERAARLAEDLQRRQKK